MARLSVYLPPFTGDYAGACSVLFGLDCLVIVIDAGCCTRNYVEYDEIRWARLRKSTFSAQLRTMDAVLGDDARIIEQTLEAADALRPSCIALVGTPVPAIVGMDLAGMAREIEATCGVPALGLATTGFESYEQGASLALAALCRRFAAAGEGAPARSVGARVRVNLLGALPQDYIADDALAQLESALVESGVELVLSTAGDYALEDVRAAATADASLSVSWSGLAAGRMLERRFGVPLLATCPMGAGGADDVARALRALREDGAGDVEAAAASETSGDQVLLVGDQVAMNSLRFALRRRLARRGAQRFVRVASFFALDPALSEPGDLALDGEAALVRFAEEHPGLACAVDPLMCRVPGIGEGPLLEVVHGAVSSTLFADRALGYTQEAFEEALETFVDRMCS